MLAKKYRLPLQTTKHIQGRTHKTPFFTLKIIPSSSTNSRFGVIVSKKVVKTAAERNRLRRTFFRGLAAVYATWPRADYIVIVHPPSVSATQEEIYGSIIQTNTR